MKELIPFVFFLLGHFFVVLKLFVHLPSDGIFPFQCNPVDLNAILKQQVKIHQHSAKYMFVIWNDYWVGIESIPDKSYHILLQLIICLTEPVGDIEAMARENIISLRYMMSRSIGSCRSSIYS